MGVMPIKYMIIKRRLLFLHSILRLPSTAVCKKLLINRINSASQHPKSWVAMTNSILQDLLLPSCQSLFNDLPSKSAWKATINDILSARAHHALLTEAASKPSLTQFLECHLECNVPAVHWSFSLTSDLFHLAPITNFRIRLVLGCHGLESDAARFRVRSHNRVAGDPCCKLCHSSTEDAIHFVAICGALSQTRSHLLSYVSLWVWLQLQIQES